MSDVLVRERRGNVLVARLNRPEARNALDAALIRAIALTGDAVDAARAYSLGLVNAVVPPEEVLPTALGFAERIAANGPLGVAATKELVRLGVTDAARATERLRELQPVVFGSEDAREGATAFVERRAPA